MQSVPKKCTLKRCVIVKPIDKKEDNFVYQVSQKKMSLSKKGAYLTKGHFFWDTL